jgi:hypothetical protein
MKVQSHIATGKKLHWACQFCLTEWTKDCSWSSVVILISENTLTTVKPPLGSYGFKYKLRKMLNEHKLKQNLKFRHINEWFHCNINKRNRILTRSGVCGAIMDPIRPIIEQVPSIECRSSVGNSSAVNTYTTVKAIVMANFPAKNTTSFAMS